MGHITIQHIGNHLSDKILDLDGDSFRISVKLSSTPKLQRVRLRPTHVDEKINITHSMPEGRKPEKEQVSDLKLNTVCASPAEKALRGAKLVMAKVGAEAKGVLTGRPETLSREPLDR